MPGRGPDRAHRACSARFRMNEVRIAGEHAFRSRERFQHEGIKVDRLVYDALAALHD